MIKVILIVSELFYCPIRGHPESDMALIIIDHPLESFIPRFRDNNSKSYENGNLKGALSAIPLVMIDAKDALPALSVTMAIGHFEESVLFFLPPCGRYQCLAFLPKRGGSQYPSGFT